MKKVLAILLCAVMALSLVACGEESKEKQVQNEVTEVVDSNNNPTDSNASIAEPSNENDMIVGSWYCAEVQEVFEFTGSKTVTATTPMVNISGSYRLEDGKITMTYDIGEGIYEYELSDSALILKSSDGTFTYIRGTKDFAADNSDEDGSNTPIENDVVKQEEQEDKTVEKAEKGEISNVEVEADKSVLANCMGKYTDGQGNSFEVSEDLGYGIYELKLYSAAGWPEYSDNDGVRFYDTPTISSVKQGNGYILVETISQYILAEGTFKFLSDGSVEVTYTGGVLTGDFTGKFTK